MNGYLRYLCVGAIAVLIFSAAGYGMPQSSLLHGLFYNANELFKKGDYPGSAAEYEKILGQNMESGNLYYNLGNAYFKMGKLGKAIVNYERAHRLIPRDSDCGANLAYALSLRENPLPDKNPPWILRVPYAIAGNYTLDELTLAGAGVYVFLALMLALSILCKRTVPLLKYGIGSGLIALILIGSGWAAAMQETRADSYAVVVTASTEAKFAPADTAVTYFKLYEGAKIKIIGSSNQWLRVKTPDAKLGWVPAEAIERI